jgi:VanZ family protein
VWAIAVAGLTVGLVAPMPGPEDLHLGELSADEQFLFNKGAHVVAYAALAALTGWLQVPPRWRPLLLAFLLIHGTATEFVQQHLAYRTGSLRDALFDHLGVIVGTLISWRWWGRS